VTRIAAETRAVARRLRAEMMGAERRLWRRLRELNRMLGTHVRGQAPVGPDIADFAELGRRVVIEVDAAGPGGVHAAVPDAWFASQGFSVVRFRTLEVERNLEGAMQAILDVLVRMSAEGSPPTPSLPHAGGRRRRRRAVAHHGGTR
jgi:very-short-patch-repair endonuclease